MATVITDIPVVAASAGQTAGSVVLLLVAAALYFLPWLVARGRDHHQSTAIFALNLFLGWTFLGWVGALIWALTATR